MAQPRKRFLTVQTMSKIAMLSALCVVLRYAFAAFPNIQPITALFLLLVTFENLGLAFLVMGLTMLISSFLLGFGPWVFFQIISFGLLLVFWRLLTIRKWNRYFLSLLSMCVAFLYGMIIDSLMAFFWGMPWWSYVVAGLPFNLNHALSTLLFYPILTFILRRFYHEKNDHTDRPH
ncbi:membrane protein [Streptococcus agalactiae LMG 14747]|uniref:Membrane protein n=2 Tax=Streptococcus TaxID=1301 RepID=V6Z0W6_STRAG|nr:ECF transporter S component [Streptococcus acidominimus]ESV53861.1 membrane protein [Streptococcus agalactiae LMG 14747]SNV43558.1 membrane protein [Streptococcus acidominimus]